MRRQVRRAETPWPTLGQSITETDPCAAFLCHPVCCPTPTCWMRCDRPRWCARDALRFAELTARGVELETRLLPKRIHPARAAAAEVWRADLAYRIWSRLSSPSVCPGSC